MLNIYVKHHQRIEIVDELGRKSSLSIKNEKKKKIGQANEMMINAINKKKYKRNFLAETSLWHKHIADARIRIRLKKK